MRSKAAQPASLLIGVMILLIIGWTVISAALQPSQSALYVMLRDLHYWLSRISLMIALVMAGITVYIGLMRKRDVTPLFRQITYSIVAFMLLEALIGLAIYVFIGTRPYDEVHLIYGMGAVLSLPFFIYVESTAKRRPAMGSYIWGFTLLAAIILRSIMTGASG